MKQFMGTPGRVMVVCALLRLTVVIDAGPARAAAPTVTPMSTTTLTTNGRTALTYAGYLSGESFQQDGILTFNGWQYSAFWDQSGYVLAHEILRSAVGTIGLVASVRSSPPPSPP